MSNQASFITSNIAYWCLFESYIIYITLHVFRVQGIKLLLHSQYLPFRVRTFNSCTIGVSLIDSNSCIKRPDYVEPDEITGRASDISLLESDENELI